MVLVHTGLEAHGAFGKERYLPHVKSVPCCSLAFIGTDLVLPCREVKRKEKKCSALRHFAVEIDVFRDSRGNFRCSLSLEAPLQVCVGGVHPWEKAPEEIPYSAA